MVRAVSVKQYSDPKIAVFRSLRGKDLIKEGIFVADGSRVFRALLESDIEMVSALMTDSWFRRFKGALGKKLRADIPVYILQRAEIEKIVGFKLHEGLMAAAKAPQPSALDKDLECFRKPHLLLALDGLKDAENIGAVIRNAAAFGVSAVITDGNSLDPYLRRIVTVSVGAIFKVPVIRVDSLPGTLKWLKSNFGTRTVVTSPDKRGIGLDKADLKGNVCIVLGSEGYGVSKEVMREADSLVKIPMSAKVDSLNVSCAGAIVLQRASSPFLL
ncbi:TrmH family RNA methyltransferase [Candidatus Omnitrophota bacterium]